MSGVALISEFFSHKGMGQPRTYERVVADLQFLTGLVCVAFDFSVDRDIDIV